MLGPDSQEVTACARGILSAQSSVPKSPAAYDESGKVTLCLAAAVAKAGFLVRGLELQANALEEDLIRTHSKTKLESAFLQLGWTVEECRVRLGLNDSFDDLTRKSKVLTFLDMH
jgi:hypothetical protein